MPPRLCYAGSELDLRDGAFVIGRGSSCDLALHDPLISRRHAQIVVTGDVARLEDLDSSNGVFVNEERIEGPVVLRPGDKISIGRVELSVVSDACIEARSQHPTSPVLVPPRETKPGRKRGATDSTRLISPMLARLSPREHEVFVAVAYGLTHREAAEQMGISVKTVDAYRANIAAKLELKSRAEIVRFALEAGVLSATRGPPLPEA